MMVLLQNSHVLIKTKRYIDCNRYGKDQILAGRKLNSKM
jgi:hypothetical protein